MSVTGGGSDRPMVQYPDGPFRALTSRELQAIRLTTEDQGTGAEFDAFFEAEELWPVLSDFENRLVVIRKLRVHLEGGPDTNFIGMFVNDGAIDRAAATPAAPDVSVNQGVGTNIVQFYADGLDIGTSDGGLIQEFVPPDPSREAIFVLDEDDQFAFNWNYGASSSENHIVTVYAYYEIVEA